MTLLLVLVVCLMVYFLVIDRIIGSRICVSRVAIPHSGSRGAVVVVHCSDMKAKRVSCDL